MKQFRLLCNQEGGALFADKYILFDSLRVRPDDFCAYGSKTSNEINIGTTPLK